MNPDHYTIEVERIPTGSSKLDEALGGGWPRGRLVEVYGKANSGKRSIVLAGLAEIVKLGWQFDACWIELKSEGFDSAYASKLGWTEQNVTYLTTEAAQRNVIEYTEKCVRTLRYRMIVVSGIDCLKREGDLITRVYTQAIRKLTSAAHATNTCVLFIRETTGPKLASFPIPEDQVLGNVLRFYTSIRVHLAAAPWTDPKKQTAGIVGQGDVVKNKFAPPFARFGYVVLSCSGLVAEEESVGAALAMRE
jgi:recombination protein RecA